MDSETQAWVLTRAELRLREHEKATSAQEARATVALTTSVALSALSGLVAVTALSSHHDNSVELAAALLAMAGFSISSVLFLGSMRSGRFRSSGGPPSQVAARQGRPTLEHLRRDRILELEVCIIENEAMMEARRRLSNWGAWTLMATPIFALLCGWLGAT